MVEKKYLFTGAFPYKTVTHPHAPCKIPLRNYEKLNFGKTFLRCLINFLYYLFKT